MNRVTSATNRVRVNLAPKNIYDSVDAWMWGPKKSFEGSYGGGYQHRHVGPKEVSRLLLFCLFCAALGFALAVGGNWLIHNNLPLAIGLGSTPVLIWIAWALAPRKPK